MGDFFYTTMPTKRAPSAFARPQSAAAATWSSNIAVSTAIVAVSAAAVFWSGVKLLRRTTKRSSTPSHRAETASALVRPRNCGRYQKGKEIGRGAFGAVYIGLDPKSGEMVAIKEMGAVSAAELRKEFDLLSGKAHPHVVAVKGYEVSGGKARLYLEWVAGGSLSDIMQRFGPVEERRLKTYVRQIVEGLQFLHQQGILHRDIKPKNILVDHTGALKLTDFGLSRHFASMHDQTRAAGTPLYMAPECMRGNFSVGSDIWAVGATMTELTTGELPWSHVDSRLMENVHVIMYHIGSQAGQRGHHPIILTTLSAECQSFMELCFAPLPQDRGTCETLLRHPFLAEDSVATTSSVGSQPPQQQQQTTRPPSRQSSSSSVSVEAPS